MVKREAFIYSWNTEDASDHFYLRMYGIDATGNNICLHVCDFMPYFYIELDNVSEHDIMTYEDSIRRNLLMVMGLHDKKDCKHMDGCAYCWRGRMERTAAMRKLYFHYEKNSFSMIRVSFPTNVQRKKAYYRLQGKKIQVGFRLGKAEILIHENEANPVLQFCTTRRIDSCGWIKWKNETTANKTRQTSAPREVVRRFNEISPLVEERSPPLPYVLSFDIEVFSNVSTRMPDPSIDTDEIFQISMIFSRDGRKMTSYLLSLGRPAQNVVGRDVHLQLYKTESELLIGFTNLIQKENPNVIIGYNIFGFDLMYMIERAKRLDIMDVFDQIGMRRIDWEAKPCHAPPKEIHWSSSAYQHQNFFFLDAEGRLFIDLLPVIRRDYKFENYRLKTISEFFIGDTKDPITPRNIFDSYRQSKDGDHQLLGRVGKYCVQDSVLVLRLFYKLQLWIGLCEMAKACRVPILTLYTQGQQIKVYSQLYFQCTHDRIVVQSPHSLGVNAHHIYSDHYSGAMVFTPDPGVYDWVIPFDFSSLYPTTIIAYNIDFSTMVLDPRVPDDQCHVIEWWDHIGCEHDKAAAAKPKTIICEKFRFRFMKQPIGVIPRLLMQLLQQRKSTKQQMKMVDKSIDACTNEKEKNELETLYQVYDKRQLAYKVSANSMYGAMGVKKGYLPFMPGAMCTTAMGRASIQKAADFVRQTFDGKIIYGDTDSIYCHFPLPLQADFARKLWDHAKHIEKALLSIFPDPMKLVFEEKIYKKFLILTKKRYMALTCDHRGEDEDKLTIRGVLLARRDNARWVRELYEYTVRSIMAGMDLQSLIYEINQQLLDLFRGMIPLKKFIISKTLGKDYAVRALPTDETKLAKRLKDLKISRSDSGWKESYERLSAPAHAQLAEKMKGRGCVVEPGSRIEYVIIQTHDSRARLSDQIEDPNYLCDHPDLVRIDPMYYAQNLINPMDQILNVVFHSDHLVKRMVGVHIQFRKLMDHLIWRLHPYSFREKDGKEILHPDNAPFHRLEKRIAKKKTTAVRNKKKKNDPTVLALARELF